MSYKSETLDSLIERTKDIDDSTFFFVITAEDLAEAFKIYEQHRGASFVRQLPENGFSDVKTGYIFGEFNVLQWFNQAMQEGKLVWKDPDIDGVGGTPPTDLKKEKPQEK